MFRMFQPLRDIGGRNGMVRRHCCPVGARVEKGLREKIHRRSIFVRKDLKFGRFEDLKLGYLLEFV